MISYQVVIGSGIAIADSLVSLAYAKSIVASCHPVVKARIVAIVLK